MFRPVDLVFRALADPSRRLLLDELRRRDGQSLVELEAHLDMTRFGVMKHLRLLEAAGLVTTKRVGRVKLHYLNPVPIRLVHDRWIRRYQEPLVAHMAEVKHRLEGSAVGAPTHVYEVYIRTTPEKLWRAITDPEMTKQYFYSSAVKSGWKVGDRIEHVLPDGSIALGGTIVECDPPRKLVTTFVMEHDDEAKHDRPSRVTWEILARGETCLLRVTHDDFEAETKTWRNVRLGWNPVLSGLKTLLETGEPLVIGPPPGA